MRLQVILIAGILWICFPIYSEAQRFPTGTAPGVQIRDTVPQDSLNAGLMPFDTAVPVEFVLIGSPEIIRFKIDTLEWRDNRILPLEATDSYLGNYGSAWRNLTPGILTRPIGFSTGWNQYDPYWVHHHSYPYYHQIVPVAIASYSQHTQDDTYLTIDFGRSFADGLNFSLKYIRSNQIGEYENQRQKNTGFGIGVWHKAPNGRYEAFYNFISNAAIAEENGGLIDTAIIGTGSLAPMRYPVYTLTGLSNYKYRSFLTKQIYGITPDSAGIGIDVFIQAKFGATLTKYTDTDQSTIGNGFYRSFLTDGRGVRQFAAINETELSGGLNFPLRRIRTIIEGAIRYRRLRVDQEPFNSKLHELYFDAKANFGLWERLSLRGDLSLGLGNATGALAFQAEGVLNTKLIGELIGRWKIQNRRPSMIESAIFVNELPIYTNDFRNPFTQEISVWWNWEKQQLKGGVEWLLFNNLIYFDSLRMPQQVDQLISLQRFSIKKNFEYRFIGLTGSAVWQPKPDDRLAIPDFIFSGSLYARLKLFRRLLTVMPGIDVNYTTAYTGVSYFPVNGVYHLAGKGQIPDYFRFDAGLTLKIKFIQFYVRMEDIVGLIRETQDKDRVLYQAEFYPHYPGYLRLGISSSFFN